MKRKILSLALCAALFSAALCTGVRATGMGEFQKQRTYSGQFSDITGKWHETYIADLYEYGLAEGMGENTMAPDQPVTVAQVTALAARINAKYYDGKIDEAAGEWYEPYISYAIEYGLISEKDAENAERPATRGESALIFSRALSNGQFEAVKEKKSFADVTEEGNWEYYTAITTLQRAGVLEGYEDGLFRPNAGISRAEAMTIADKVVNKSQRSGYNEAYPYQPPEQSGSREPVSDKWLANKASGTFTAHGLAMVNVDFEKGSFTMAVTADIKGGMVSFSGVCETKEDADGKVIVTCIIKDSAAQGGASLAVSKQAEKLMALAFEYDGYKILRLTDAVVDGKLLNASSVTTARPVVYVVGLMYIGMTMTVAN